MSDENNICIIVVCIIVVIILFWMLKPNKNEKYNVGNNINFRKTKTDRDLPASVMPVTNVPNIGSPFMIIDNP